MVEVVPTPHSVTRVRRVWLRMFLTGLALWVAAVVIIFVTGNANLIPTVVLLGSFLVPVTTAMEWGGLALISIVGIAWLVVLWRRAPRPVRVTWGTARSPLAPTMSP